MYVVTCVTLGFMSNIYQIIKICLKLWKVLAPSLYLISDYIIGYRIRVAPNQTSQQTKALHVE